MNPTDLSPIISKLTGKHKIPPRLLAHLSLVYDVAKTITIWLHKNYPQIEFDENAVLFGAATHDIGKVIATDEITKPGSTHEKLGYQLLIEQGMKASLARFTYTHSSWTSKVTTIEDWIVSLADKVWRGTRLTDLEDQIVQHISDISKKEKWQVFLELDDLLTLISQDSETRIAFQTKQDLE
ncbi:HD domain-containing protein [Shimazuella sp. AN120528]|uniref:HD domain-containing protein n=1 Tax=Shimazuella soli TaxID=1892854 RepID=UPI001F0DCB16|nr:HD domain-containing protein [Shimazuella soli]MCH5584717.1 HD domain-containing protein [Shimazuella soli]